MNRYRLFFACLILAVSLGWLRAVAAAPLQVAIEGDRLTLHATQEALSTILGLLADQGVRIRIDPRINPTVTARFDKRPIGTALASILKSVDYALIWRLDKHATTREPKLWEIRIFYKGHEERIQPLRRKANLDVVTAADGTRHVRDVLLLRLRPGMSEADLAALADRLGASVLDGYPPLGIVRLRLPYGSDVAAVADAVADTPGVERAEPDTAFPLEGGKRGAGAAAVPPDAVPAALSGDAVVAVMDSGLSAAYANSPFVRGTFDAVSPDGAAGDELGHGTQMALIAAGAVTPLGAGPDAAAGSPVVAVRAFDDHGFTSTYTLIRGIDYAVRNGARVVSLSWGSETPSPLLESAVAYAADRGLIVVAAAGNAPTGDPVYPAAYDTVIGVGALTPDGKAWEQSNHGAFVSVSAPGLADLPVGYQGDPGVYAGTSIATAYVARQVAAIINQNPDADRATIVAILKQGR